MLSGYSVKRDAASGHSMTFFCIIPGVLATKYFVCCSNQQVGFFNLLQQEINTILMIYCSWLWK